MTTDEVLEELEARGLRVELEGGAPRLRGPKEKITPNLLAVLRWHREEIARRLAQRPAPPPDPWAGWRHWIGWRERAARLWEEAADARR